MSTDDKKPPKRDPFAPLPLDEALTGKTKAAEKSAPAHKPDQAAPTAATRSATLPPPVRPATIPPPIASPTDASIAATSASADIASEIPTLDPDPDDTGTDLTAASRDASIATSPETTSDAAASATFAPAVPGDTTADNAADGDDIGIPKRPKRSAIDLISAPKESWAERRRRKARERENGDGDNDDDDDRPRKSRTGVAVAALALVVGGGIAAAVLLGRVNSGRYAIVCTADHAVVERGRVFPPWGTKAMLGGEWVPLELPPEAPCAPRETENLSEVSAWFGKMLEDRATTLLTAREVSAVDQAEGILKQALLVSRSLPTDDDRIDSRERIERMLGDVAYWRASARLKAASEALVDAANQFDAAALQKPRYVTDAAAWAAYARKLVDELAIGPAGVNTAAFPPSPPPDRPTAPVGTELPVEPSADTGSGSAPPAAPPPAEPPATPSGGGVLL